MLSVRRNPRSPLALLNPIEELVFQRNAVEFVHPTERNSMKNDNPWIEICPGIKRQTASSGKTMYQMTASLEAGSKMPEHQHPQEQIVYILSGRMKLIVNGTPHELLPGDSFYLGSHVPHGVETVEATRVLDTFSPPRDEYLAIDEANRQKNG